MKYLTLSVLPDAKISICWKIRWKVEQFSSDFPLLISHTPRFMFISISVGQECYALCSFIKGRKIGSKMHKQTLNSETIIENWKKKLFDDNLNIYCVSFVNSLLEWLILKNDEEDAIWFQLWIANIKKSHYVGFSLSLTIWIDLWPAADCQLFEHLNGISVNIGDENMNTTDHDKMEEMTPPTRKQHTKIIMLCYLVNDLLFSVCWSRTSVNKIYSYGNALI